MLEEGKQQSDDQILESVEGLSAYVRQMLTVRRSVFLREKRSSTISWLQGEYNRNFWFIHPCTGRKLVLRVNYGSQMHLDNQILYEYNALKALNGCEGHRNRCMQTAACSI